MLQLQYYTSVYYRETIFLTQFHPYCLNFKGSGTEDFE